VASRAKRNSVVLAENHHSPAQSQNFIRVRGGIGHPTVGGAESIAARRHAVGGSKIRFEFDHLVKKA
jgi:hypothetical protein